VAILLEPSDHELIRRLSLPHRHRTDQTTGEQRSPALGGGIEFADYREYAPGDDVRLVDWTVFLRLRRLLVKLCAEEHELTLSILVDHSRSMDYGNPSKLTLAKRMAAVLGGIALASGNRAEILSWGNSLREVTAPLRGERSLSLLAERVLALQPEAEGHPLECVRRFSRYAGRRLAVLLTDFLHDDWQAVITGLGAGEAHVVHVLSPQELEPVERGEVTLVDQETGEEAALLVDAPLLELYRDHTRQWLSDVASQCRTAGVGYALVPSDSALPRVFLDQLTRTGLVC
jgi:uncharacterized protein (DUF58 family)